MAQRCGASSAWGRLAMVLSMVLSIEFAVASAGQEACEADSSDGGVGSALLQAGSTKHASIKSTKTAALQAPQPTVGTARSALPSHLYELGMQLLQTEGFLDAVVASTVVQTSPYAGVNVTLRMVGGNEYSVIESDTYGIDSLNTNGPTDMMNMLDIGGNYGRVSIAAFKNFQSKMRIIVVEPLGSTYFLLRWNLWLNNVTELTLEELQASPSRPGVVALNNGIADMEGAVTDLCYRPPITNFVKVCTCTHAASDPNIQCHHIVGRTSASLVRMFGNAPITLLKMDCEGCELHVLPELSTLIQTSGLRIERFAGELHAVPNELEEFACNFDQGQWFQHVCGSKGGEQKLGKPGFAAVMLPERCAQGQDRPSCSRKTLSEIRDNNLPPSEW